MSSILILFPPALLMYYFWRLFRARSFRGRLSERTSLPDAKGPPAEPQPWTRQDVYHTAFLLRQKLPAELVPEILDFAEYWIRTRTWTEDMVSITQINCRVEGSPEQGHPYLSTQPIGMDGLTGLHPVRKVVFKITSKDQGYSWDSAWHGSYENSWTWFEATVESADHPDISSEGKRIITNVHAGREYKTHVVSWSANSGEEDERWVRSLKRGQVITLRMWARFPGWENNINSAQIDVYTAAIR